MSSNGEDNRMGEQNFTNYAGEDEGKEIGYKELFEKYPDKGFILVPIGEDDANWETAILLAVVEPDDLLDAQVFYGKQGYACMQERECWRFGDDLPEILHSL